MTSLVVVVVGFGIQEQKRFAEESKVLEELVHDQEETLRQVFDQTVQDDQVRHAYV